MMKNNNNNNNNNNDLFQTFFRTNLIQLKHIINQQISNTSNEYSKQLYQNLSITKKLKLKLLNTNNKWKKITKHDIIRAFIITNDIKHMIKLSIQKQKYLIQNILKTFHLNDEITIYELFQLIEQDNKQNNISNHLITTTTNKNIQHINTNDQAFIYTIWYAQQYISSNNLKSSKIQKRKYIKPYWKSKKWKEDNHHHKLLTNHTINWLDDDGDDGLTEAEKETKRLQNVKPPMKIAPEPPPGGFENIKNVPMTIRGLIGTSRNNL